MRKIFLTLAAFILIVLAVFFIVQISQENKAPLPKNDVVLANGARLIWQDCWFEAPKHVDCANLHTAPEKKGQTSSFALPVVVMRYQGFDRKNDPIVYMAGGPGSGAGLEEEQINGYWLTWFKDAGFHRDLILFDQRGTGLSKPKLKCPEYHLAIRDSFIHDTPSSEKNNKTRIALQGCYQTMKKANVPVDEVSTLHSAADVNDLMETLNYPTWNLQGVSYSTRLAIVIERKYPGRVRSMVLDSVYPIQKHFYKEWPELLDSSLKKIFSFCDHQATCKREFGNIETKFWETMEALKKEPLKVNATGPHLVLKDVIFDDETLLDFLFDIQYESGSLYDIPAIIDAFHRRDSEPLKVYINDFLQSRLQGSVSEIVFRVIECKDNPSIDPAEMTKIYEKYPKLLPYLSTEYDACDIWDNKGEAVDIKKLTEVSDIPVLILAGEDDPVTPIGWVDDILEQYPNSQFFSFPNISHSVMDRKSCGVQLFSRFVNDPTTRPTADCRDYSSSDKNNTTPPNSIDDSN
ncbi:MAG: alpha/beta hydrolase [Thiotrichaceae bacterium]